VNAQRSAEIQTLLEGIPLPAEKSELISYMREQDESFVGDLEGLPSEQFRTLDEVGRLLTLVPTAPQPGGRLPRAESGKPPGGEDYLQPFPEDTGKVRHDAPPTNPPEQAIEKATKKKKRQKAAEGEG
jgi:hypothetical protein